jgi:cell division septation protein DedD
VRATPAREREGFIVQFASLLSEERARAVSSEIRVDGQHPRVVTTRTDGTPVYRVILGPYPTRSDAERIGKASGHSFWVIEGIP